MYRAAEHGHLDLVKHFVQLGEEDEEDPILHHHFNMGLNMAVANDHLDIVKYLIKHGANGWDWALHAASRGGHIHLIDYFIKRKASNWNFALEGAAARNNLYIVKYLVDRYDEIPAKKRYLFSSLNFDDILMCAVEYNSLDVIEYLIPRTRDF